MSLSHLENMPLNESSPQGATRSSWKLYFLYATIIFQLLCFCIIALLFFLPSKEFPIELQPKFRPRERGCMLGMELRPLHPNWQTTSFEPRCMELDVSEKSEWKVKLFQSGVFVIYSHMVPNSTYNETAPFEVQLRKNSITIQTLTDKSKIQNVGGIYELHAADIITLRVNHKYQVLENETYWGILLLAQPGFIL
ncbi:PREDICTED: tumor necrosis factor ligand superfamily member 18-like [Chrysochloris asiatica]|uniref:Tumor necrosis factor ligand superfamily member 18-like n=1 Tax=Chrysochloris asiatica TaxID=185453 RepID=A0A9B0TLS4_CHRAS|nr:PREDICTED: tumor necrosis factor ligand superfamily member 18-like [Chrysochloris asiatica]